MFFLINKSTKFAPSGIFYIDDIYMYNLSCKLLFADFLRNYQVVILSDFILNKYDIIAKE